MYQRKKAPDGTEYVTVTQEVVVNIHLLKENLAKYRAEEAGWRKRAEETEVMIAEVEKIAPDLLLKVTLAQTQETEDQGQPAPKLALAGTEGLKDP